MSMNCLERLLLLCDEQIPEASHSLDERVRLVIQHIHGHLRDPLSLESLSGLVHLSESRFSHLFRDEFGMAPQQYIAQQRLQRAATLLERTTHSIGEVAAEIGMEPFHFSAKFKAHTGVNPREYRRTRAALDAGAS
jgi:AraC family transcriptional regulator of arabinose operon